MTNNSLDPSVGAAWKWGQAMCRQDSDPKYDSQLLLMWATGYHACDLITKSESLLTPLQYQRFKRAILKHKSGYPTAYLLGEWDSFELTLSVNKHTLIPRSETEIVIETALTTLPKNMDLQIADLGTGSGTIALNLAHKRAHWQIVGTDLSQEALNVAIANAHRYQLNNVTFLLSDWYNQLDGYQFDAIISNPPYIAPEDPHLAALSFEPQSALVAADNGLAAIKQIITQANNHLKQGGWLILEHGYEQGSAVCALLLAFGFTNVKTLSDLSGNDRLSMGMLDTLSIP